MKLDNLRLLIINSHFGSRSTLRDVCKSFLHKVTIHYAQNLREALRVLQEHEVDVGFVAFEIGQAEISDFVRSLLNEAVRSRPPFIATLRSRGDGSTSDITSLYLEGISGFISEPYSSDDILRLLSTMTQAQARIEQKDKLKKASGLLLTEAARKIDSLAESQANNDENAAKNTIKGLKTISKSLETMYSQDSEQYANAIIDVFENIAPPATELNKSARNRKSTVKEIMHPGKLMAELMQQRKLTFEGIKHTLKIDAAQFQDLLDGKTGLDETSSRDISRIFGRTSREWLKMQKDYDAHMEEKQKKNEASNKA